jgi:hypothetical protein
MAASKNAAGLLGPPLAAAAIGCFALGKLNASAAAELGLR